MHKCHACGKNLDDGVHRFRGEEGCLKNLWRASRRVPRAIPGERSLGGVAAEARRRGEPWIVASTLSAISQGEILKAARLHVQE